MRCSILVVATLLTAMSLPTMASNVLLPDDDNGTSRSSLGLIPHSKPTSPSLQIPTAPTEKKSTPSPQAILNTSKAYTPTKQGGSDTLPNVPSQKELEAMLAKIPASTKAKARNLHLTPGGRIAQDPRKQAIIASMITSNTLTPKQEQKDPYLAAALKHKAKMQKQFSIESTIMDELPPSAPVDGKYSINIGIDKNYEWSLEDLQLIQIALGYTPNQVPQNCQLRLDARLETDISNFLYTGTVLGGTSSSIKYSGILKAVSLQPMVLCNPPQELPRAGFIITRTGNLYSIMLMGNKKCVNNSNKQYPSTLSINYPVSQKTCKFE